MVKEFLHLYNENCISKIFGLFLKNAHKWSTHHVGQLLRFQEVSCCASTGGQLLRFHRRSAVALPQWSTWKIYKKRQKEKITKIVWFYQGWALQMGAGLEKNIQWSQSVQIWGCQRPLRLWKWDWRTRKSRIRVFQLLLFWFTKRKVEWGGSDLSANWFQKEPRRPHAVPRKPNHGPNRQTRKFSRGTTPPHSNDAPAQ